MSSVVRHAWVILRNDLRLLWRELKASRLGDYLSGALAAVLFTLANVLAIALFFAFRRSPALGVEHLVWLIFGFFMIAAAMNHAIKVLFEHSDFDLLLSSPVPPAATLLARLAAMSATAALSVALFLLPLLHGAILAVSAGYLAGYAVWLLLSCAVASAGVWFTLLLVQWLGPRRARIWAQVIAGLLGTGVFIVFQAQNLFRDRDEIMAEVVRFLGQPSIAWLARAGRGDPGALLGLAGFTLLCTALTARLLAKLFIGGVQEGNAVVPKAQPAPGRRYVFIAGIFRATLRKDIKLIARDPLLLAQVLPSALYLLPALFSFKTLGFIALLAPLSLVITTQFSFALTAVAAAGEECWDLIRASPTDELRLRCGKMAAGLALPFALCVPLTVMLALLGRPALATLTLVFSLVCGTAMAWLMVARVTPTPRRDILTNRTKNRNVLANVVAAIFMLAGGGGLGCAAKGYWIAASILLALTMLVAVACFTAVKFEAVHSRQFESAG